MWQTGPSPPAFPYGGFCADWPVHWECSFLGLLLGHLLLVFQMATLEVASLRTPALATLGPLSVPILLQSNEFDFLPHMGRGCDFTF